MTIPIGSEFIPKAPKFQTDAASSKTGSEITQIKAKTKESNLLPESIEGRISTSDSVEDSFDGIVETATTFNENLFMIESENKRKMAGDLFDASLLEVNSNKGVKSNRANFESHKEATGKVEGKIAPKSELINVRIAEQFPNFSPMKLEAVGKVFAAAIDEQSKSEESVLMTKLGSSIGGLSKANPQHVFEVNGKEFIAILGRDSKDEKFIKVYQKIEYINEGAYGLITRYKDLDTGKFRALKEAKPVEGAVEDVIAEGEKLMQYGGMAGVQARPYAIIVLSGLSSHDRIGYMGKAYNGDGDDLIEELEGLYNDDAISLEDFLSVMDVYNGQLITGFNNIESQGGIHFDIKPGNILYKEKNPNIDISKMNRAQILIEQFKSTKVMHADLGGDTTVEEFLAQFDTEVLPETVSIPKATSYCISTMLHQRLADIVTEGCEAFKQAEGNKEKQEEIRANTKKEALETMHNLCSFAMGVTLFELNTRVRPNLESVEQGQRFGDYEIENYTDGYETSIAICLKQMENWDLPIELQDTILGYMGAGRDFIVTDERTIEPMPK